MRLEEEREKHNSVNNSPYRIGFYISDITPPLSLKVRLGGYIRFHKYAKKVLHPIKARAFCIRDKTNSGDAVILISVDLVGGQYRWSKIVRRIISKYTSIPISNIIIHFTHSHSTPDMIGLFVNKLGHFPRPDVQYPVLKYIMKKIIEAGIGAYRDAVHEFKIGYGITDMVNPPIVGQREPPYKHFNDPIRFIKITDAENDDLIGVIINYQGHPTQLPQSNSDISPEYPGILADLMMERFPGLKFAAYFNGAIGDVSVLNYRGYFMYKFRKYLEMHNLKYEELVKNRAELRKAFKKARRMNGKLHKEAMEFACKNLEKLAGVFIDYLEPALERTDTVPLSVFKIRRRFVFAQIGRKKPLVPRLKYYQKISQKLWVIFNDFKNLLRIAALIDGYKLFNGRDMPMLNIIKNGKMRLHQTELQVIRLNDIFWMSCPGEPFILYQNLLSSIIPGGKAIFNSMSNDTCGYIFPWSFYVRGGYETLFSFDMLYGEYIYSVFKEEIENLKE